MSNCPQGGEVKCFRCGKVDHTTQQCTQQSNKGECVSEFEGTACVQCVWCGVCVCVVCVEGHVKYLHVVSPGNAVMRLNLTPTDSLRVELSRHWQWFHLSWLCNPRKLFILHERLASSLVSLRCGNENNAKVVLAWLFVHGMYKLRLRLWGFTYL